MKCKITRHTEGVDEDGAVVTTLVTAIGNHQGADHVEVCSVLCRRVGGRWIIVYVSSVSFETHTGPLTVLLEMKTHVPTTIMPPIDEAAMWVKLLVAVSHLEVPGSTTHNSMCDLYLTLEKVSRLLLRSTATYSTNDRSSFIRHEPCQELTEGVVKRQA
jgi:hypothetical protein